MQDIVPLHPGRSTGELVSEINLKVRKAPTDIGVRRGEQRYENIEQDQDRYSGPADHH